MPLSGNVSFNNTPANLLVPLFYAEMDNSQANIFQPDIRVLLMGQVSGGTATVDTLTICSSASAAITLFGAGSELAEMVAAYRRVDGFGELWCLPLADGGVNDPVLTTAIANMGDEPFDFIATPFREAASLTSYAALMDNTNGRWSPLNKVYGHIYMAASDTHTNLVALAPTMNNEHYTVFALEPDFVTSEHEYVAARVARESIFLRNDPARPTQTGEIGGVVAGALANQFTQSERNILLGDGLATHVTDRAGVVRIERSVTTYTENAHSQPDISYRDSETMHQSARILRELMSVITSKMGRVKIADDGTRFGRGNATVTPAIIWSELAAVYRKLEFMGLVENAKLAMNTTIVTRNINDPNRVDVLFAPDYVNQLRVFAVLNQFRLQYPDEGLSA